LATDQIVKEQVFPFLQTNIIPLLFFLVKYPGNCIARLTPAVF
jgi:hypothetical protein